MNLLYDVSRLSARVGRCTPSGIDRVDFAYLQALAQMSGVGLRLVSFDTFGPRLWSTAEGVALQERARQAWAPPVSASASPAAALLRRWLDSPPNSIARAPRVAEPPAIPAGPRSGAWQRGLRRVGEAQGLRRLLAAASAVGEPTVYLNTSHGGLFRRAAARWFARSGVACVFFVHDLIPIRFPQYNRPQEPTRHAARLATIAASARAVLVNSQATRDDLLAWWRESNETAPPVHVAPLGVDEPFTDRPPPTRSAPSTPYFAVLGTIEPRKNHRLMLDLWDDLVGERGHAAPRLVLLGRRGWRNEAVFARLDGEGAARTHVAECAGLGDEDVARILMDARALLMPSFAEGYGLPVAEALALGTPVVASDLPALREVAGAAACFLDPLDRAGWRAAILDHLRTPDRSSQALPRRTVAYRAPSWAAHFEQVATILESVANEARRSPGSASRRMAVDP